MIKIIDRQNTGFLEDRKFKNKNQIRLLLFNFAKNEEILTATDLRKIKLNELLDIWDLDIEENN